MKIISICLAAFIALCLTETQRLRNAEWNHIIEAEVVRQTANLTHSIQSLQASNAAQINRNIISIMDVSSPYGKLIPFELARNLPRYFNSTLMPLVKKMELLNDSGLTERRFVETYFAVSHLPFSLNLKVRRMSFYQRMVTFVPGMFALKLIDEYANTSDLSDISQNDILRYQRTQYNTAKLPKLLKTLGITMDTTTIVRRQLFWYWLRGSEMEIMNPRNYYSTEEKESVSNVAMKALLETRFLPEMFGNLDLIACRQKFKELGEISKHHRWIFLCLCFESVFGNCSYWTPVGFFFVAMLYASVLRVYYLK